MSIKTMPLSRLEADLTGALNECADSGGVVVVELPDKRLVAIQALEPADDDDLIDRLIASNAAFRDLVAKSKAGPRRSFPLDPTSEKDRFT